MLWLSRGRRGDECGLWRRRQVKKCLGILLAGWLGEDFHFIQSLGARGTYRTVNGGNVRALANERLGFVHVAASHDAAGRDAAISGQFVWRSLWAASHFSYVTHTTTDRKSGVSSRSDQFLYKEPYKCAEHTHQLVGCEGNCIALAPYFLSVLIIIITIIIIIYISREREPYSHALPVKVALRLRGALCGKSNTAIMHELVVLVDFGGHFSAP